MDVAHNLQWATGRPLNHVPTANQMARRQDIQWREVNLLDPLATGMEPLTFGMIMDVTGGPHSVEEARAYLSGIEEERMREEHGPAGGQYVDEFTYHTAAAAFPQHISAYIFHQAAAPGGWNDGNGNPRPGFPLWEPCDLILGTTQTFHTCQTGLYFACLL